MLIDTPERIGTCPNCAFDLESLRTLRQGELEIVDGGSLIRWQGLTVALSPACRTIVRALAADAGHVVKNIALVEAMGSDDLLDPTNLVKVQVCRTRKAFRRIDPAFDQIETWWGLGYRWRGVA